MNKKKFISIFILIIFIANFFMPIVFAANETIEKATNEIKEETTGEQKENTTTENTTIENKNKESENKEIEDEEESEEDKLEVQTAPTPEVKTIATPNAKNDTETYYKIKATVGSNMYLDVNDASKEDGANLQIWSAGDVDQQKFKLTKLSNGYYKIEPKHAPGKVIDVSGAGQANGTNVNQFRDNGTEAQMWKIRENSDGTVTFISKCNNKVMDLCGGASANRTNVQIYDDNGTAAQRFILESEKAKEISGTYKVRATVGNNMYLDVSDGSKEDGANLQIWAKGDVEQQKFKFTKLNNGYYKIEPKHASGKVIDVSGGETGTNVWQFGNNGTAAQMWEIRGNLDGTFTFISKCNNKAMDLYGGASTNGTNVQVYNNNGTAAQKFVLEPINEGTVPKPPDTPTKKLKPGKADITDGIYMIKSKINKNMVFDIDDPSSDLHIWSESNTDNQKFKVTYLNNGYYSIRPVYSKKSIDVAGKGQDNGTNVWQYPYDEGENTAQQWIINKTEDGNYMIGSKCNDKCITIQGNGNVHEGSEIYMWDVKNTDDQKFIFQETSYQVIQNGMYEIAMKKDPNKLLDIAGGSVDNCAKVQIFSRANVDQQKFYVTYNKVGDFYTFQAVHSSKYLDVPGGEDLIEPGTQIWQYTQNNDSNAQKWKIIDLWNGTYNIVSLCKNLYLDVDDGKTDNGTKVKVFTPLGTNAQAFIFTKTTSVNSIDDNKYPGFRIPIERLKAAHPNWEIRIKYTGLDWDTVLSNEDTFSGGSPKSLIPVDNRYLGEWKVGDPIYDRGSCYQATRKAIAYMMDPRNSLDEDGSWLFQFQDLSSSSGTKEEIKRMVSGTFLDRDSLINAILQAAQTSNISPFHIASRIKHEMGPDGGATMNGHYTYKGRTVYNLYNIDVDSGNDGMEHGAKYAYDRNWFTPEASIIGGAEFLGRYYIGIGQNTLYFQKYNVVSSPLYQHQYMQNIRAANDEGNGIYYAYKNNGLLNSHFTFVIPVYENMPASPSPRPNS